MSRVLRLPPIARSTDSSTSHKAGEAITNSGHRKSIVVRCLAFIRAAGAAGATSGEVADGLGMEHQQVWRRCSDLQKMGLVYRDGTRVWCGTGRSQAVHKGVT